MGINRLCERRMILLHIQKKRWKHWLLMNRVISEKWNQWVLAQLIYLWANSSVSSRRTENFARNCFCSAVMACTYAFRVVIFRSVITLAIARLFPRFLVRCVREEEDSMSEVRPMGAKLEVFRGWRPPLLPRLGHQRSINTCMCESLLHGLEATPSRSGESFPF